MEGAELVGVVGDVDVGETLDKGSKRDWLIEHDRVVRQDERRHHDL